jgi:hypothetical protein
MGRKFVSGHEGRMPRTFISGNEFCNTKYEYTEVAEEEDTTCSGSAGFNEFEYGNRHIEGSMEMDWDAGDNTYTHDPSFPVAGNEYAFVGYLHAPSGVGNEAGPKLEMDKMKVNNVKISAPSKGKITINFDFKSSGRYSLPNQASDSSSGL